MEYKGYHFELNRRQDYEFLRNLVAEGYTEKYSREELTDWQSAKDLLDVQYRKRIDGLTCIKEWQFYFEMMVATLEDEEESNGMWI